MCVYPSLEQWRACATWNFSQFVLLAVALVRLWSEKIIGHMTVELVHIFWNFLRFINLAATHSDIPGKKSDVFVQEICCVFFNIMVLVKMVIKSRTMFSQWVNKFFQVIKWNNSDKIVRIPILNCESVFKNSSHWHSFHTSSSLSALRAKMLKIRKNQWTERFTLILRGNFGMNEQLFQLRFLEFLWYIFNFNLHYQKLSHR